MHCFRWWFGTSWQQAITRTHAECQTRSIMPQWVNITGDPRWSVHWPYINGLVQERRNSSVLAMELRLSCINPSICGLWPQKQIWDEYYSDTHFAQNDKHELLKILYSSATHVPIFQYSTITRTCMFSTTHPNPDQKQVSRAWISNYNP